MRASLVAFLIFVGAHQTLAAADEPSADDVQDLIFLGPMRPLVWRLHITIDGKPFRTFWQERLDKLFSQQDVDRDGRVNLDQASAIERATSGSTRVLIGPAGESALRIPLDADGTIGRAELAAYLRRILPPLVVHRRAVAGLGSLALFPLLDVDDNHQLTREELDAAQKRLQVRDFNDDRAIARGELVLDPKLAAIDAESAEESAESLGLDSEESTIILLGGSITPRMIAVRLLEMYDRNRDKRLRLEAPDVEASLPIALARRLDTNGDRSLDHVELARFGEQSADVELFLALGRASLSDSRNRPRSSDSAFRIRKTLEGGYDLKLGDAQVKLRRNNSNPEEGDPGRFTAADRDNNNYVDRAEAAAVNIDETVFAIMDADGDGMAVRAEFNSYVEGQDAAAAARLRLEVKDLGQDLFKLLDIDEDGVLSVRELRLARAVLETHDTSGDGVLNGDEIPQTLDIEIVRGVDPRPEPANQIAIGAMRSTAVASSAGPLWFRKMDRNNDGDLDRREFLGPQAKFDVLDTDHDGLIDRTEAEAAGK